MAHDVEYCFDGAVELGYMTADVATFFRYYHPDPNGWHDRTERPGGVNMGAATGRFEQAALAEYIKHRPKLTVRERAICSYEGLIYLGHHANELSRDIVGSMLALVPEGHVTRRVQRRLLSPDAIRRFAKKDRWHEQCRTRSKALMKRAHDDTLSLSKPATDLKTQHERLVGWINDERMHHHAQYQLALQRAREQLGGGNCTSTEWREAYDKAIGERKRLAPFLRKARKQRRKVIQRGYNLLASVTSDETARMFVGGNHVSIEGQRFTFIMRKKYAVDTSGHSGLEIQVAERGGPVLSNLCMYFEGTPAIDQVAAIAMHVAVGEETELIKTGNLYAVKPEAQACKELVELKNLKPPEAVCRLDDIPMPYPFKRLSDDDVRTAIRHQAVPICQRIVLELIHPRLVHLGEAHKRYVETVQGTPMPPLERIA